MMGVGMLLINMQGTNNIWAFMGMFSFALRCRQNDMQRVYKREAKGVQKGVQNDHKRICKRVCKGCAKGCAKERTEGCAKGCAGGVSFFDKRQSRCLDLGALLQKQRTERQVT